MYAIDTETAHKRNNATKQRELIIAEHGKNIKIRFKNIQKQTKKANFIIIVELSYKEMFTCRSTTLN